MDKVIVHLYDVFTTIPGKGNSAGVVLNSDSLSEVEMQKVASQIGLNETAFVEKSINADFSIRFFTPKQEVDLCGHATIASIHGLNDKMSLSNNTSFKIETKSGILPINTEVINSQFFVRMKQNTPIFRDFFGSHLQLADSIGISEGDICSELPIVYGNTGVWTLLVPIKKLETFKRMKPQQQMFPSILKQIPTASIHPFCLETFDLKADMHGRHFSSFQSGMIEDSVTGTASGVMGAYYAKYILGDNFDNEVVIRVEQGHEVQKDGFVQVKVTKDNNQIEVYITGNATYSKDIEVLLKN